MSKPEIISLCSGGGCCPDMIISEDASVTLQEDGQVITLNEAAAKLLAEKLRERGYLDQ